MRSNLTALATVMSLCAALALPVVSSAQEQKAKHPHYKLIDLGTLGGTHSYGSVNGDGFRLLNNAGVVASYADLSAPDPNAAFGCEVPDCLQIHAFQWKDGVMTDLGALPVNNNSAAGSINARGWAAGQSQSSVIDPILGVPEFHGVLWKDGQVIDLGTLGGTESLGVYVNDAGQVIGFSTISTEPDPVGFIGFPTHTFLWQNGEKTDIGTLGGANAFPGASCSNQPEGVVVGGSNTSTAINPDTGLPDAAPFLWHHGKMINLGTIGGTNGYAQCANGRGQVVGQSSVAANPAACDFPVLNNLTAGCHAFFWQNGVITDLGTLGGDNSEAIWLNEAGEVAGSADMTGSALHHAVFWRNGKIHDLGTVPGDPCSRGRGLNARGQVVGGSSDCFNFLHAFVWDENTGMVDLNTVMSSGTGYQVTNAFNINDRGEVLAKAALLGFTPNDDEDLGHLVLLVPCDPETEDCSADLSGANFAAAASTSANTSSSPVTSAQTGLTPRENMAAWRARTRQHHLPTTATAPTGLVSEPGAILSPTSLTFSTQAIGTTSAAKTVTLKNTGTTSLTITAIAMTGTNAGDFAQTHNCGSSLAAGASCSISLTFKPTASGTRTAALRVSDNAPGSPQQVVLGGVGTTAKLSATSLTLGTVAVGTTSPAKTVTLTNVGATTLTISGITMTGTDAGDFTQSHNCGSSLAAGANCSISVAFKPIASGTRTATLSVADNAGSPQHVVLGGVGTTAKLSATSLSFGTVPIGTTSPAKTLTLTNVGATTFNIANISASSGFEETNTCGSSLASAATCTINVTFTPTAAGNLTGTLSVTDTAPGSPQRISLSGIGAGSLTITSGAPPNGIVGTAYGGTHFIFGFVFTGFPLNATGGSPSYTWSWAAAPGSSLPPGLNVFVLHFGGSTRCCVTVPVISGTPTAAGSYNVIVTVTDSGSPAADASAPYTIVIGK